ncbi:archaellin/type IV pilin N-terminal domain-containing protein [Natronosalvus halobius]|uniref:archaellin/type IV pilin N-terminal domain-containing protein n=1 Tax=Natronosalvus halobius TaxID=2953746 RepID=UPI00209D991E|nr:archaellin/type IV pilin N-terminal domain-containing protein [Natronosalvus halobius]USZ70450.1 flagellin [Natronosalvus halobius]
MFENLTNTDERGQVGIGTLIVFIAMVLVAAIAAGVLINTAGSLQSQASDTGTETQQAVANQIEVVHAVAETNESGEPFEQLNLTVKKSAGSDVIDLTAVTVQYTDSNESLTLAHESVVDSTNDPYFNTTAATTDSDANSLTDTSDRVVIAINLNESVNPSALNTGDSATVEIVDQSGAKFTYGVTMPQTVSSDQTVVNV